MDENSSKMRRPAIADQEREFAVFLADVVGCVGLYKAEGDIVAERLIREALDGISAMVCDSGGAEIKRQGDAILAVLDSPQIAADIAVATQVRARAGRLRFRIALDTGRVVVRSRPAAISSSRSSATVSRRRKKQSF